METEAANQMANQLRAFRENMLDQSNLLSNRINNQFIGTEWQGQAAETFRNEYNDWANYQLLPRLKSLEDLEIALRAQIQTWMDTSAGLTP
jgi:uncharacterized protein YukE